MSKIPKRVFLKFNGQEHVPPKLKINLDLATFEGSKPLPWEPVTVEFLGQQKRVSTEENGLKMNVELEFLYVHEEIKAKLSAWITSADAEVDKDIAEYDVLLPGAEGKIETADQTINNLREEMVKLNEQFGAAKREVEKLNTEKERRESFEDQTRRSVEIKYELIEAKEVLRVAEENFTSAQHLWERKKREIEGLTSRIKDERANGDYRERAKVIQEYQAEFETKKKEQKEIEKDLQKWGQIRKGAWIKVETLKRMIEAKG